MNANEIHAGKDYLVKIAFNEVKVKVRSHTGHSWIVRTAGGRIMPIQNIDRFVKPLESVPLPVTLPVPEEPQNPVAEAMTAPIPIRPRNFRCWTRPPRFSKTPGIR